MKNLKTTILKLFTAVIIAAAFAFPVIVAQPVYAAGTTCTGGGLTIPKCTGGGSYQCANAKDPSCLANNPIVLWITFFINLVSVLILVGASAMLVYAGVEYISAADNPQRVQAAKQHIINVIIGLVAYFFLFSFVQWLIPGGVF